MVEIKSPNKTTTVSLFLAGSIEMGSAEPWRLKVTKSLENYDVVVHNPLRETWDSSWKATIDNPLFVEQVEWELRQQEKSDIIFMYFDPNTQSPISLLELGLFANQKEMIVCCPDGFWRKGNVDVVCKRYGVTQIDDLTNAITHLTSRIGYHLGRI